jgi:hypothetical protein
MTTTKTKNTKQRTQQISQKLKGDKREKSKLWQNDAKNNTKNNTTQKCAKILHISLNGPTNISTRVKTTENRN